jgi:hypothetical protein
MNTETFQKPSFTSPTLQRLRDNSLEFFENMESSKEDIVQADRIARRFFKKIAQNEDYINNPLDICRILLTNRRWKIQNGLRLVSLMQATQYLLWAITQDQFNLVTDKEVTLTTFENRDISSPVVFWPAISDWILVYYKCELWLADCEIAEKMTGPYYDKQAQMIRGDQKILEQRIPVLVDTASEKLVKLFEVCYNSSKK